ncbi:MAG: multidrug resistance protein [Armatimonadota bacterium]|nr:multidrug resistance protein [Armatimonadota bacterium]MCX7776750.1 multidrug resistance protein [Armatimonadota bacterium]MDW8024548.1 multidrug resistance protein [Armatimonadota bacterium]
MGTLTGTLLSNTLILILIAVILGGIGQALIQLGASQIGEVDSLSQFPQLLRLILSPGVLGGLLTYAISAVLYVVVVSKRGIGYAYPFVALNQVIIVLISWLLFNQTPPLLRLAGVALICIGVLLVAKGG